MKTTRNGGTSTQPSLTDGSEFRPPKAARLDRGLRDWATQQVMHENAHLRAQVASLQREVTWAKAQGRLTEDQTAPNLLFGVRMVQDFDVSAGGFPHQYVESTESVEGGGDAEVPRIVSARKMLRLSGRLLTTFDEPSASAYKTVPVNASVFGPEGVLYAISLIDSSSGNRYTLEDYPGISHGMPFLEWPNGDRARDHFRIGPDESAWTVRFRFPHVPRDRKDRVEWRLRVAPKDEATRLRYPALSFETATFRACARIKDE